jgi:death-on-curing protein
MNGLPSRWKWVAASVVFAIHDAQLAEHGGMAGVRDRTLVEPALARPLNLEAYGEPDVADLAAAYAYGISRNHGFVDGNKRTAYVVAYVFLLDNGYDLVASDAESVATMLALAAGELTEPELAAWFRVYLDALPAEDGGDGT